MKIRDAMTPDVQLCTPEDTLRDAAEAMGALNCGLLPVSEGDRLVGMISDRDIAIRGVAMGPRTGHPRPRRDDRRCQILFDDQDIEENKGDIQVRRLPSSTATNGWPASLPSATSRAPIRGTDAAAALSRISRPGGRHAQA